MSLESCQNRRGTDGAETLKTVSNTLEACGIPLFGFVSFAELAPHLLPCAAARRLPADARTVVIAAFPYFCGNSEGANLSKYAMPEDYHLLVGARLRAAAERLAALYHGRSFESFCDSSPIPEVSAACRAGLGVCGRNGLLITKRYGSFVFLGELVTDLALPAEPSGCRPVPGCEDCGACVAACPGTALSKSATLDRPRCVSFITQKKGGLSAEEAGFVRAGGSAWGCDRCQDVCPHNRRLPLTTLPEFRENRTTRLDSAELDDPLFEKNNTRRAFLWRGKSVLQRNLGILAENRSKARNS